MEKSINSRYYLDYNATSPLAKSVINFFESGDFLFGNPSSIHSTGKKSKKYITETSDYLFKLFSLSPNKFDLIFHSGATEGINSFFKGIAFSHFKSKKQSVFFFSTVDHSAVINLEEDLRALGHDMCFFGVNSNGDFDVDSLILEIKQKTASGKEAIINFTHVNNETGVVWPLELAVKIKSATNAIIHVDSVQSVGKIDHWQSLSNELDAYTYSGHKFGAMKSVGFSFFNKAISISPLLSGGGQQSGRRSGTENALGIYSLKLALNDLIKTFDPICLDNYRTELENILVKFGTIVSQKSAKRNLNTIFVVYNSKKFENLNVKLDMAGLEISNGSACSSGIIKPNRILLNLGFSKEDSLNGLRFSLSPYTTAEEIHSVAQILLQFNR